jgi:two-component system response regulator (stage 0 sporulation protein F)
MVMKKDIKILVVDDEEIMRDLFTDILQDEGYSVTTVANGKEAQERAKAEFFDIAFVDVHMPVMDGLATLYALRELSPNTVIVMTDSMPGYMVEEAKKEGAVTCIRKPFDIKEVRSVISGITKGSKNG